MERSVEGIQERIDSRRARVYTASEFKALVRGGRRPSVGEVDAVTCGTMGVMSGTMAVLSVPVAGPGEFVRADSISLNGVPGTVGPCPNESLGLVDCVVYGTSRRDASYGGGHLFRDMVAGLPIDVRVVSDGRELRTSVTLPEIPFARMVLTRGAFRNYTGFVNPSDSPVGTIFSGPGGMPGGLGGASVSGCGEINPVENDPSLDYLRPGASVMLNGAPGIIIGTGTRSTPAKPNLSVAADMHLMRADLMGGFRTSAGPECVTSVAAAIPVTSERALDALSVLDGDIPLPMADVRDRVPVCSDSYGSVWQGTDLTVSADPGRCRHCPDCVADRMCPADATPSQGIDPGRCFSCGLCVGTCVGGVFSADLGDVGYLGNRVRVGLRQSSRAKAESICSILKDEVEGGRWHLRAFDARERQVRDRRDLHRRDGRRGLPVRGPLANRRGEERYPFEDRVRSLLRHHLRSGGAVRR